MFGWEVKATQPRKKFSKPLTSQLNCAIIRVFQEEQKGRNRKLSSRNRNRSGRKKVEGKGKRPKARAQGKHLRNSCGSESGKGERKHTAMLSTGTGKERMGNQAGENGEDRRSESESGALRKPL